MCQIKFYKCIQGNKKGSYSNSYIYNYVASHPYSKPYHGNLVTTLHHLASSTVLFYR